MPSIKSERPAETRDFFVDLLGFDVAMDIGWVVTVASPTNASAQVTVGNDDMAAPGISVDVADVDAVHATAVKQLLVAERVDDLESPWGVRRFMLREPSDPSWHARVAAAHTIPRELRIAKEQRLA